MPDLETGNSIEMDSGRPQGEPDSSSGETSNPNGEARQSATIQESFVPQGMDVNTLPPNVRTMVEKINSDMVRGFTEKTTKLSETIKSEVAKSTESYKSKAEFYDQLLQQESFVKQWNDYVQKANAVSTSADVEGNPAIKQLEDKFQQIQQKLELTEMNNVTDSFADAVDEKGEKINPEFDMLNGIVLGQLGEGPQAEEFSLLRACIELSQGSNPQEKLANGFKMAKEQYNAIFEEGRKAGMGRIQSKVKNGSLPPTNVSGNLSVTEKRPRNAQEALEMARKGIVVSR